MKAWVRSSTYRRDRGGVVVAGFHDVAKAQTNRLSDVRLTTRDDPPCYPVTVRKTPPASVSVWKLRNSKRKIPKFPLNHIPSEIFSFNRKKKNLPFKTLSSAFVTNTRLSWKKITFNLKSQGFWVRPSSFLEFLLNISAIVKLCLRALWKEKKNLWGFLNFTSEGRNTLKLRGLKKLFLNRNILESIQILYFSENTLWQVKGLRLKPYLSKIT